MTQDKHALMGAQFSLVWRISGQFMNDWMFLYREIAVSLISWRYSFWFWIGVTHSKLQSQHPTSPHAMMSCSEEQWGQCVGCDANGDNNVIVGSFLCVMEEVGTCDINRKCGKAAIKLFCCDSCVTACLGVKGYWAVELAGYPQQQTCTCWWYSPINTTGLHGKSADKVVVDWSDAQA